MRDLLNFIHGISSTVGVMKFPNLVKWTFDVNKHAFGIKMMS